MVSIPFSSPSFQKFPALFLLKITGSVSLVNLLFKILIKLLANRPKQVTYKVIGDNQIAFIRGRQITDSIMLVNEIIHNIKIGMHNKGNIVFKLNFEKAFDCVN